MNHFICIQIYNYLFNLCVRVSDFLIIFIFFCFCRPEKLITPLVFNSIQLIKTNEFSLVLFTYFYVRVIYLHIYIL